MSSYERSTVVKTETSEIPIPIPAPVHTSGVNTTCEYHVEQCKDDRGFFEKVKDAITGGDNPAKKAEDYTEKAGKEVQKEVKLACEARKYADKAAEQANKYTTLAEEKLVEKDEACRKQMEYTEMARIETEKLNQCKEMDLSGQAAELKCAGSKLQHAH